MNTSPRTVGIWYNALKPGVRDNALRLRHAFEAHGAQCPAMRTYAQAADSRDSLVDPTVDFQGCDLMCALGGDGTLLMAMQSAYALGIPIVGVNMGRMGFLTEVQPSDIEQDVARIMSGAFNIERRMLLSARMTGEPQHVALNEVAINRTGLSIGILSIEVYVGGVMVDRFSGDGLIVASSTGSTAYSLSAGGPIVAPGLDCMVLTPICSHTLHVRPVIVSPDLTVEVRVVGDPRSARVVFDGHTNVPFPGDEPLRIERAERGIDFVKLHERNFFDLLLGKLSDWTH